MHTPCDTDILLVTHPKVGTTWTKAILFALKNRMHYPDLQEHPLLTNIPHDLVPLLEGDIYTKKKVLDLDPAFPRLISTHLPYALLPTSVKDSTCKIVYVYRNPKNTFVSLWHFQNRLYPTTNSLEEAFDKPKDAFLKYEEMKEQPTTYLKRIVEFLDCPFSLEEEAKGTMNDISRLCSFDNLSNLDVNKSGKRHLPDHKMTLFRQCIDSAAYFHQGNTGDWVNFLTPKMAEKLDHIIEEKFHGTGLKL
ncbi:hypothetical protein I3760_Q016600 [Carya illinoinensis]|nr:hypothetical protein I3760_Q016600 [Carya illinoinensis]